MFPAIAGPRVLATGVLLACVLIVSTAGYAQDRRLTVGQPAERRLALVIGNDSYPPSFSPLRNARNDARAIAAALREVGFTVIEKSDLRRSDFGAELEAFGRGLTTNDVALFFYAGHGLQLEGENYLMPVDFSGQSEAAARWDTIPVGRVHDVMRKARVSMIVLDACRNNPFGGSRSAGGGLAAMEARGSLIAFAAGAGQTASDNTSSANGLFTTHLLSALRTPGLGVREVFRRTREQVVSATNGNQFPAVYDGLIGEFVFRDPGAPTAPRSKEELDVRAELAMWEDIGRVDSPTTAAAMLEQYIRTYPAGNFRVLAFGKLMDIRSALVKTQIKGTVGAPKQFPTLEDDLANCDAGAFAACAAASDQYRYGDEPERHKEESLRLAERSCAGGYAAGCVLEGDAHLNGDGTPSDMARAVWLYRRACTLGNGRGCNLVGSYLMYRGEFEQRGEAAAMFERGCSLQNTDACHELALAYEEGRGVASDRAKAMELYRRVCDGGWELSCFALKRLGGQ